MKHAYESEYLAYELTPRSNYDFILAAIEELRELEESDGHSWEMNPPANRYWEVRPIGGERPHPIAAMGIRAAEFSRDLIRHGMTRCTGIEWTEDQARDEDRALLQAAEACCTPACALLFQVAHGNIHCLWFHYDDRTFLQSDTSVIKAALNHLGSSYSLMLIDWYHQSIIDLASAEDVERYLGKKKENIRSFQSRPGQ